MKTKTYFVQECLREEKVKRKIRDEKQRYLSPWLGSSVGVHPMSSTIPVNERYSYFLATV